MKIAIVSQPYYPIPGGVTEHVWHLGKELERRGHAVTVITGGGLPNDHRGLRVLTIGKQFPVMLNGANVYVTLGWRFRTKLRSIEKRERFNVVHIHSPLDPFLPLAATQAMQAPKVGTYHTYRENSPFLEALHGYFTSALQKLSAHIAVSKSAANFVQQYYPTTSFRIIPNGIDTMRFTTDAQPFPQFRDGTMTILYVGRMDPRKGARYLFAALSLIAKQLPSFRLLVVGSGWMKNVYDKFIPPELLSHVHFAGYVSPEELPRYYRSADMYCSPATGGESFGIVLLEAMASGLPIVASDIVGYHDVVENGREGLLVPPKSPRHIAEAIVRLARSSEERSRMAAAGRKKALLYDWKKVTDQVEKVYGEVLASRLSL